MGKDVKGDKFVNVVLPSGKEIRCKVESAYRDANMISLHPIEGFFPWDEFSEDFPFGNLVNRLTERFTDENSPDYFNIKVSPQAMSFLAMLGEKERKPVGKIAEEMIEGIYQEYRRKRKEG